MREDEAELIALVATLGNKHLSDVLAYARDCKAEQEFWEKRYNYKPEVVNKRPATLRDAIKQARKAETGSEDPPIHRMGF
jgi:hypothetical protein